MYAVNTKPVLKITIKILFVFFCFCLFTFGVYGQSITWQRVYFSTQSIPYKTQQTQDGGYITTGYVFNNGSKIFLLKQNAFGDSSWNRLLGDGTAAWVEQTMDKGYIIAGASSGGLIIKTDSLGNIAWQKKYTNFFGALTKCIKQTTDSGYVLIMRWGLSNGQVKIMLIKTDRFGNTIFEKIYYGPNLEAPGEVTIVNNSGYVICGTTGDGFIEGTNIYVLRVNISGDTLWTRNIGAPNYGDISYQIQNTADGGFILAGWTESFTMGQNRESYVIKLDSLGLIQWQKRYSSLGYDETHAIRVIPNGYVIAGYSDTLNNGDGRAKLRILDNSGNIVRQTSFKPTEQEVYFTSVEPTSDNGYVLCGETHNAFGSGRVYVTKTDSLGQSTPIGISNYQYEIPSGFILYQNYPNPFNPVTKIKFDVAVNNTVQIVIYDITGKEIDALVNQNLPAGSYQAEWNAANFASGIYFVTLLAGTVKLTRKIALLK